MEPTAKVTGEHAIPGGTEVDVTIDVPTPAGQVNPDTPVVPADDPTGGNPVPAGIIAESHGPDVLVVTPPTSTGPAQGSAGNVPHDPGDPSGADTGPGAAPANEAVTGADVPAIVSAGDVLAAAPRKDDGSFVDGKPPAVARVDDPDKTLTPATDLAPGTAVHNPALPVPGTGPVTADELAATVKDGENVASAKSWQSFIDALDAAGYVITRK